MSLHSSLKIKGNLSGKRNVLTRAERIEQMKAEKRFDESKDKALGLPKTRIRE
ncbi:MAG: small basic protein [Planctomycetota bacterium]